jgi:hypothetical protein
MTKRLVYLAPICLIIVFIFWRSGAKVDGDLVNKLVVRTGPLYSMDPMEYDYFAHHQTQRPVLATLITNYKAGDYIPVIAKGWSVSDDKREWSFQIREGLTFQSGDPIDPQAVALSLTRTAYIMNKKGSRSGLFEFLENFQELASAQGRISGISYDSESVRLKFTSAPNRVLEKLSFGLYAIAHKDDFDSQTGKWHDPKSVNASGPYSIESWENDEVLFSLRSNWPISKIYGNDAPFAKVLFVNRKSPMKSHVTVDTDNAQLGDGLKFRGNLKDGISFIRLVGDEDPQSVLNTVDMRRAFRKAFYDHLNTIEYPLTRSFLPLEIAGVTEIEDNAGDAKDLSGLTFRLCRVIGSAPHNVRLANLMEEAFTRAGVKVSNVEVDIPRWRKLKGFGSEPKECDGFPMGTGILVSHPFDDLKFMIESEEGIQLPDRSGALKRLVSGRAFDPQIYNQLLWDEALVWPVSHYGFGIWIDSEVVDAELLNFSAPPTEIALMRDRRK